MAGGFAFDSYAFGRIDRPMTQAVFVVYLLAAGGSIALLHRREARGGHSAPPPAHPRLRTALVAATQFSLGALLSGFCVFYIRSASIGASWPFLLFMAAIFIGNEYFRAYASRLVFAVLLFFFSLYSYAILLVPVVLARMGPISFLISGAVAVVTFFFYVRVLALLGHDRYRLARKHIAAGMIAITALFNLFYFTKIFPPLPLVLADAGVYHGVKKIGPGYQVVSEAEPPRWRALFGTFPVLHMAPGEKLYLYSAVFAPDTVFAPNRFRVQIEDQWQWRDPKTGAWLTEQTIPFAIGGGRAEGYRAYTYRSNPKAGDWRVNILTRDGRAVGRMRFSVQAVAKPPPLTTSLLK